MIEDLAHLHTVLHDIEGITAIAEQTFLIGLDRSEIRLTNIFKKHLTTGCLSNPLSAWWFIKFLSECPIWTNHSTEKIGIIFVQWLKSMNAGLDLDGGDVDKYSAWELLAFSHET